MEDPASSVLRLTELAGNHSHDGRVCVVALALSGCGVAQRIQTRQQVPHSTHSKILRRREQVVLKVRSLGSTNVNARGADDQSRQDRPWPCRLHVFPPSVLGWPARFSQLRGAGLVGPTVGPPGVSPLVRLAGSLRRRHEALKALHQQCVATAPYMNCSWSREY